MVAPLVRTLITFMGRTRRQNLQFRMGMLHTPACELSEVIERVLTAGEK